MDKTDFYKLWNSAEQDNIKSLKQSLNRSGIHDDDDIENFQDKIERQFRTNAISNGVRSVPEFFESYTNKDMGINKACVIDQSFDGQTNQDDINKAVGKIGRSVKFDKKTSATRTFIENCISHGYYGYLLLRKSLGCTLEHPRISPWYARCLPQIPFLINPGGQITILEGKYDCASAIIMAHDNVSLRGVGRASQIFCNASHTGNGIQIGDSTNAYEGIEVKDLLIDANLDNRANFGHCIFIQGASGNVVQCKITGIYTTNTVLSDISNWRYAVLFEGYVDKSEVSGCVGEALAMASNPCYYNRFTNNDIISLGSNNGIAMDYGSRSILANNRITTLEDGIDFDGPGSHNVVIGNMIYDCNGGVHEPNNNGIELSGQTGVVDQNVIIGNRIDGSGHSGIYFKPSEGAEHDSGSYNVKQYNIIKGNIITNPGQDADSMGIRLDATSHYNLIEGNIILDDQGTHTMTYGIYLPTNASNNRIINNSIDGYITSAISNSGTSTILQDNKNYNPVGNFTAPSVPASTSAYTNAYGYPCMVSVYGGTVSAVAVDGVATGLTSGSFVVAPSETITLTYSSVPTWVWYGL